MQLDQWRLRLINYNNTIRKTAIRFYVGAKIKKLVFFNDIGTFVLWIQSTDFGTIQR